MLCLERVSVRVKRGGVQRTRRVRGCRCIEERMVVVLVGLVYGVIDEECCCVCRESVLCLARGSVQGC